MLPKIVVTVSSDQPLILEKLNLDVQKLLQFDCKETKIIDLRRWINSSLMIAEQRKNISVVLWGADLLSEESQSVLLKPLEEVSEKVQVFLIVENENFLLPTIQSRCVAENLDISSENKSSYWEKVSLCWKSGPASCINFVDDLDKEEYLLVVREIIEKMRGGIKVEVNGKRLLVLQKALVAFDELSNTNINGKMVLDNFIMSSWRAIKS